MKWTELDIPDLSGKVIIVTGANSGIGFEATRLFAKRNAEVIMACRSMDRGETAFDAIKKEVKDASLTLLNLDLASFNSIQKFAETVQKKYDAIDVLLNNAGIMMTPYGTTVDGIEQQQGVNHFGHFLLTNLLFDLIKKSDQGRIVNISSIAHRAGSMNFDNLLYEGGTGYNSVRAYGRSKLENLLFTYELADRVSQAGLNIRVLAAHPGVSKTNLSRDIKGRLVVRLWHRVMDRFTQSAYQGALPGVRAAVDSDAANGTFYGPDKLFGVRGNPVECTSTKRSKDKELMVQLWNVSEKVTNKPFDVK